jgi:putative oxidoreductase
METILLITRVFFGLALAAHGSQKLFGWFGGHGLAGTGGFFEMLGFKPGHFYAAAAGLGEVGGGLLLAVGLFGPLGPAMMITMMLVAALTVHVKHGFFSSDNGVEMPMLYAMAALFFAFSGPGIYSLDALLGMPWVADERLAWIAVVLAVFAALVNVAISRRAQASAAVVAAASPS